MFKSMIVPQQSIRIGKDPDGVIDNRPGVAHPSSPKEMSASSSVSKRRGDDFARHREFGTTVVNQTNKSEKSRNTKPELPIGTGVGVRSPKRADASKKRKVNKGSVYKVYPRYLDDDEETLVS